MHCEALDYILLATHVRRIMSNRTEWTTAVVYKPKHREDEGNNIKRRSTRMVRPITGSTATAPRLERRLDYMPGTCVVASLFEHLRRTCRMLRGIASVTGHYVEGRGLTVHAFGDDRVAHVLLASGALEDALQHHPMSRCVGPLR